MENTLRVVERVEKTHKNLGLPTMFGKLVDLSNLGLFLDCDRGKGKTTILETLIKLRHRDVMKVSIITFAGVAKMTDQLTDRSVTVINPDFSTFYTPYLKDVAVNLISALITDHAVKATTGKYKIEVSNCYLSFLSATQPQMIRRINRLSSWESMYRDRFLRFHMLYPFGTPKYTKNLPNIGELFFELNSPDQVSLPHRLREHPTYERLKTVIQRQTSEGRCGEYLDRLLKAHAWFNSRDIVIQKDLQFLELMIPYLMIDLLLSMRQKGVSEPMVFNANSFILLFYLIEKGESSRRTMREVYNVSHSTIIKNLNPLMASNIIKGTYGKDEYRVNPKWYTRYIKPIQQWGKEIGIY